MWSKYLSDHDRSLTKLIAIMVGTIASLVLNSFPVFLAVISRAHGYQQGQSGLAAFVEMGGVAIGSTLCALQQSAVDRVTWRGAMGIGMTIFVIANTCTAHSGTYFMLLVSRMGSGAGAGIVMAITYAYLKDGDGARWLALFNVAQTAAGGFAILCIRPIADGYGLGALFYVLSAIGGIAILMCLLLPARVRTPRKMGTLPQARKAPAGNLDVYSVFFFFAGGGAVYAFLAFMGVAWGGTVEAVDSSLSKTLFAAMASGISVALMGSRFGFRIPLYTGYAAVLICMSLLAVLQPVHHFTLICCAYAVAWNVLTPFQFKAVTYVDGSGRAAMLVNACTYGGQAIGPAIGGLLVTQNFVHFNVAAIGSCIISLALICISLRASDAEAKKVCGISLAQ
jgi:predicted MFS family arabinose efflux permease